MNVTAIEMSTEGSVYTGFYLTCILLLSNIRSASIFEDLETI